MLKKTLTGLFLIFFICLPYTAYSQDDSMAMPPANVVVSSVSTGMVAPEAEFIGTVYYQETSEIAAEISGKAEVVNFEEGDRVKKGDVLVRLDHELLEKTLQATQARHEQVMLDLEQAEIELKRAEQLFSDNLISEQSYDEKRFRAKGLQKNVLSLKFEVERLEIELRKKSIKAPYDGIVIKKNVDRGEWLSPDSTAMTIAKDDYMLPVVNVPENIIDFIRKDQPVEVRIGIHTVQGKVVAVIPIGDISTRTFPVKIGIRNTRSFIEGMEARFRLPSGEKKETLVVSRDAVISMFGMTVVFAVIDSKAKMIPVKVAGYEGDKAGIYAEGISEGMKVVIKGNERLQDGQAVIIK
jgi:RND family efflux transporter MFP subunit